MATDRPPLDELGSFADRLAAQREQPSGYATSTLVNLTRKALDAGEDPHAVAVAGRLSINTFWDLAGVVPPQSAHSPDGRIVGWRLTFPADHGDA